MTTTVTSSSAHRPTKRMDRTQEFMEFLREYLKENGHSPSFDDIKEALGLRSKGSVATILKKLADEGRITYVPRRARTIRIA